MFLVVPGVFCSGSMRNGVIRRRFAFIRQNSRETRIFAGLSVCIRKSYGQFDDGKRIFSICFLNSVRNSIAQ